MKRTALIALMLTGCTWISPFGPYEDLPGEETCVTTVYWTFADTTFQADSAAVSDSSDVAVCALVD